MVRELFTNKHSHHSREEEGGEAYACWLPLCSASLTSRPSMQCSQSVLFRLGPSLHFTPPPLMTIATTFARENAVFVTEPVGFKLARLDRWWWCAVEELPRVTVGPGRRRMETARRGDRERNCNLQSKEGRKKGREEGGREGWFYGSRSVCRPGEAAAPRSTVGTRGRRGKLSSTFRPTKRRLLSRKRGPAAVLGKAVDRGKAR